jgi:electron transfer flavoprotein beta subunit
MMGEVGVCLNWVDSATEPGDHRFAGLSLADQAALELALRHAATAATTVHAVSVGGPMALQGLRAALACGADRVTHLAATTDDSATVAALLAAALADATWVWCGDYSPDGGTGAVPAFLAGELRRPQALGVVAVQFLPDGVEAIRRLDGGRREMLRLRHGVISVEGAAARLRRASLTSTLRADRTEIPTVYPEVARHPPLPPPEPYRPRARAITTPRSASTIDRLHQLTAASGPTTRGETVELAPAQAAARIIEALTAWGYVDTSSDGAG